MILLSVIAYVLVCNILSIWASRYVLTPSDYAYASGRLSFSAAVATTFASWFGASSMLASPAVFISHGTSGLFGDPYGAVAASFFVAAFMVKRIFRARLYAIGDLYRMRYNSSIELLTSIIVILSYLGWVCGLITCMGLILNVLSDNHLGIWWADMLAAVMMCVYSIGGGMWSLAITDYLQCSTIIIGFLVLLFYFSNRVGGFSVLVQSAIESGRYQFFPHHSLSHIAFQFSDFFALFLGVLPQQDLFQRIVACRTEKIALRAMAWVSVLYLMMSNVPLLVAFSATIIAPEVVAHYMKVDPQLILPEFVLAQTPFFFKALFFGALFAGLLSGSGTALLAPATTISKNIIPRFFPHLTDRQTLFVFRLIIAVVVFSQFLVASVGSRSIYRIVINCYSITCVSAAVPLLAAFFWPRANSQGAFFSIVFGFFSWMGLHYYSSVLHWPSTFPALLISCISMIIGSLLPRISFLGRFVDDSASKSVLVSTP